MKKSKFALAISVLLSFLIVSACQKTYEIDNPTSNSSSDGTTNTTDNSTNSFVDVMKSKTWVESTKGGDTARYSMRLKLNEDSTGLYTYLTGIEYNGGQPIIKYDSFPIFWKVSVDNVCTLRHTTLDQQGIGGFKIHNIKDSLMATSLLTQSIYPDTVYFKRIR